MELGLHFFWPPPAWLLRIGLKPFLFKNMVVENIQLCGSIQKMGSFTTNSAYLLARAAHEPEPPFQGHWIWKLDMLPRIINFLWLFHHNSVPIRDVLASRGNNCGNTCPLCNYQCETIVHLLRDCAYARDFEARFGFLIL